MRMAKDESSEDETEDLLTRGVKGGQTRPLVQECGANWKADEIEEIIRQVLSRLER